MNKKLKRATDFQDFINLFEGYLMLEYQNKISSAQLIIPAEKNYEIKHENELKDISIISENVIKTIKENEHALVLVFASANNPGGGVKRGSIAQEEEIAFCSSWYFQAKEITDFYKKPDNALNTEKMIFVKNALLFKDEEYNLLEKPIEVSLVGCAAPNIEGMKYQQININMAVVKRHLEKRIENILNIASKENAPTLILGAWGCGVFGLPVDLVAQSFKNKIQESNYEGKIIFSIANPNMVQEFKKILKI